MRRNVQTLKLPKFCQGLRSTKEPFILLFTLSLYAFTCYNWHLSLNRNAAPMSEQYHVPNGRGVFVYIHPRVSLLIPMHRVHQFLSLFNHTAICSCTLSWKPVFNSLQHFIEWNRQSFRFINKNQLDWIESRKLTSQRLNICPYAALWRQW